jgi:hypothetical protein
MLGSEMIFSDKSSSAISTGNDDAGQLSNITRNRGDIRDNLNIPMNPSPEDIEQLAFESGKLDAMVQLTKKQSELQLDVANKNIELTRTRINHYTKAIAARSKYGKLLSDGLNKAAVELMGLNVEDKKFNGFTSKINQVVKLLDY